MKQITQNLKLETLIKDVKREILLEVILGLRHYQITMQDAHYLAKDLLAIFPVKDIKDMLKKLNNLGKNYKTARKVFIKHANKYFEEEKRKTLETIPPIIEKGWIIQAVTILKEVNYHG